MSDEQVLQYCNTLLGKIKVLSFYTQLEIAKKVEKLISWALQGVSKVRSDCKVDFAQSI